MYREQMIALGRERSAIRELFEYGSARKKLVGEDKVFDFSIGNPSAPPPPAVTREIRRLTEEVPPEELHAYTSAPGLAWVRKAVADHLAARSGVPMSEDLVYMTCGASASLAVMFHAVLEPGEEVVVPSPYFPEYAVFVRAAGGELVPVPTDARFHLDLAAIERAVTPKTRAVLINTPNNPTGAVYGAEEMRALGALLRGLGRKLGRPILLIADEPYRELVYGGESPAPAAVYENTVILYSFSKSMTLAGERIGYIAVPPQCAEAEELFAAVCGAGRSLGFVCAPAMFQRVAAACLGETSDLAVYRANRDLLYGALSDMGYTCAVPEGAFYLFVQALEEDAAAFAARAREFELLLVPSDSFGVGGHVRISYCVPRAVIERSLPAFARLYASYRRSSR